MHPQVDVVVVGGGIAGLSTAYELTKRGIGVMVLERAPRPGGVIFSEHVDGFTIDAGPDALLTQKPDGIRLCEELGLGDRLVPTRPPRVAFVQRAGRLHPLPSQSVLGIPTRVGPFMATGLFSWSAKLRMGAELFVPPKRDEADESIGSFMRRRFGAEAVDYLAEPLLAGIHAGDVDRLSVRALFPRFVDAEQRHGSLLRAFRKQRRDAAASEGAFRSLPGGLSELVRALVAALPTGAVCLSSSVGRILLEPDVSAIRTKGHERFRLERGTAPPLQARAVVLATPAYVTSQLLRDIDRDLSGLCAEVPYASTATVALAFARDAVRHPLDGSGFVVPRVEKSGIMAASWLSSKWPHRAPADRVLMRAFIGGARDPRALERSDDDLVSTSLAALRPLLDITAEPVLTRVYRFERASAQHEVGHTTRLAAIEKILTKRPGLFITGSGFRSSGIPDCVADARATAKQVTEWLARS